MSDRAPAASNAQLGRELASARQQIDSLQAQLRQASRQTELLLHEVSHRVGNNLAVLLGILDRERAAAGVGAETALKLSRFVLGLAVAHRLLSETGWRPLRLSTLCRAVREAVAAVGQPAVRVRVADSDIEVPSRVADRISVVLSELALNSLKHCREREAIDIEVRFEAAGSRVVLEYRDSGPGYPSAILAGAAARGGLELVSEVARHGLDGDLMLSNDSGAIAKLTFSAMDRELARTPARDPSSPREPVHGEGS